jgi:hypothetical protein
MLDTHDGIHPSWGCFVRARTWHNYQEQTNFDLDTADAKSEDSVYHLECIARHGLAPFSFLSLFRLMQFRSTSKFCCVDKSDAMKFNTCLHRRANSSEKPRVYKLGLLLLGRIHIDPCPQPRRSLVFRADL